jgi:anti-sigma regulatory factor (Ser/Thr protein kinase)
VADVKGGKLGMDGTKPDKIVFRATIDAIEQMAFFLEEKLEEAGIPMMEAARIQLAAEEAVTNVINHGYEGKPGNVSIQCRVSAEQVKITITDTGPAFDPTKIPPADVMADLDHRKIGGLGIHLIRSVMDEVAYSRDGDENRLVLVKNV